ncbi:MAG: VOC family protein [Gammaproteobacteria bacterium]
MQQLPVSGADLGQLIAIDSSLFGTCPTVQKPGNAKWTLDDPRGPFALFKADRGPGLPPLGIQTADAPGLEAIGAQLNAAWIALEEERNGICCTARSDKYWVRDPQGIHWKSFLTHEAEETGNRPETRHAYGPCPGNHDSINGCI